jgi:4-amino-4-deoxy-L-arabinose transferase-like glycosyltransferase
MTSEYRAIQPSEGRWLALIVGVGLALRAAAIASLDHVPESDELAYISMAINLLAGHGIVDAMGNHAMYNVGYPLFVLAPVFSVFGESLVAGRLANLLLGGVTIVFCHQVAREAGAGPLGRLAAAALWAIYLPASVYGVYLLKENLMTPLMLGVVWCALRLARQPSARVACLCGVLLGLLALTGNAALSLVAVAACALALAPATPPRRIGMGVTAALLAVAVATPWTIRNLQVVGAPVLNTNGGFNLYLGNNPAATGMFVSIADTPRGPTWEALRKTGEVQASETLRREAVAWVRAHPGEFVGLALRKAAYFWTPPLHEGKGESSTIERVVRLLWAVQFIALAAAALGSVLIGRLRNRQTALLWLALTCYTAVHMLFYVIFRYREPIMPVLVVLAALTIEALVAAWLRLRGQTSLAGIMDGEGSGRNAGRRGR